jgi:DNA invertase Pin-like site-specific DNA recombinase
MKKVAIYIRVSTNLQKTDMQLLDLKRYSKQRNFSIYKTYEDQISGSKEKRPALNKLMDDALKRKFDVVLVWRFDRFARSTKHLLMALETFQSVGIDFISYSENIDTSSPLGKAIFTIISAMAQLERDIIRERVIAGLASARAKGKVLGRPQVVNKSEVIKLRKEGLSYRKIANKLNISHTSVQQVLKSTL